MAVIVVCCYVVMLRDWIRPEDFIKSSAKRYMYSIDVQLKKDFFSDIEVTKKKKKNRKFCDII